MSNSSAPITQRPNNSPVRGQIITQLESFSGPLPPPQILSEYEKIVPGSAAKILDMAVGQSEHRKSLETNVINSNITNSRLGLYFGLLIGLTGIIAGTVLGLYDKQIAGGVIGGGSLVSLVGVFIYGSQQRQKERVVREKELKDN